MSFVYIDVDNRIDFKYSHDQLQTCKENACLITWIEIRNKYVLMP